VWSGGGVVATQCPASTASGNSEAWLELFVMWQGGSVNLSAEWWAKDLDAMTVLANEARRVEEHK
jgi:hypothetical protein